jgi:hypothetical protein
VPVSRRNIGRRSLCFRYHFSDIVRFWPWTENPRVGGSIPPLATIQINISDQEVASGGMDSWSNIGADVQYFGPLLA